MGEDAAGAALRILVGISIGIGQTDLTKASESRTGALYHRFAARES
jgi:hypothetical protein